MAQYLNLREEYDALRIRVERALRVTIAESKHFNDWKDCRAIRTNHDSYEDIAIINDKLTLIDVNGYDYDISVLTLDELIDILNQQK